MTSHKVAEMSRILGQVATGAAFTVFFGLAGVATAHAREGGVAPQKGAPVPPGSGGGGGCYDDGHACDHKGGKADSGGKGKVEFKAHADSAQKQASPASPPKKAPPKTAGKQVKAREQQKHEPRRSARDEDGHKDDHRDEDDGHRREDRDEDRKHTRKDRDDHHESDRGKDRDEVKEDHSEKERKGDHDRRTSRKAEPDEDEAPKKPPRRKHETARRATVERPAGSTRARRTSKVTDSPVSLPSDSRGVDGLVADAGASLGNSIAHNPEAAAAIGVGGGLMSVGEGLVVAGGGLSLTGFGAVVGAPMALAGGAVTAGGAVVSGLGLVQIVGDAMGQYRVVTPEAPAVVPAPAPFAPASPVAPELPQVAPAPATLAPTLPQPAPPGRPIPPVIPGGPDIQPDHTDAPRPPDSPRTPEHPRKPQRPDGPGAPEQPGRPGHRDEPNRTNEPGNPTPGADDPDAPTPDPADRPPLDAPERPSAPERPEPPERPERVPADTPPARVSPLRPSDHGARRAERNGPREHSSVEPAAPDIPPHPDAAPDSAAEPLPDDGQDTLTTAFDPSVLPEHGPWLPADARVWKRARDVPRIVEAMKVRQRIRDGLQKAADDASAEFHARPKNRRYTGERATQYRKAVKTARKATSQRRRMATEVANGRAPKAALSALREQESQAHRNRRGLQARLDGAEIHAIFERIVTARQAAILGPYATTYRLRAEAPFNLNGSTGYPGRTRPDVVLERLFDDGELRGKSRYVAHVYDLKTGKKGIQPGWEFKVLSHTRGLFIPEELRPAPRP
jgi:hypothetical protein